MTDELDEKFVEEISNFVGDLALEITRMLHPNIEPLFGDFNIVQSNIKKRWKELTERFCELVQIYD